MTNRFAPMPEAPYYAVIFANRLKADHDGYEDMGERMFELAMAQPGCIGAESTRDESGFGITVSYWQDEASLLAWKANIDHLAAQRSGMEKWYEHYRLRVAKVERGYCGPEGRNLAL
ncbi:antibiotic biosynthesis monooxygenase [uncultured Cohaesibacter sp.]|uniref:antibiotic biosynthesis monooxygenase family protein n=1 Tax=uncultured Cohaesibacter sp. TaxID=1002546 RepID=UPI00292E36EE|nr:antibiotic biosynthesis monooxygenase [uncultured Cohaesibacter sp.]